jgi:hypothetical protein
MFKMHNTLRISQRLIERRVFRNERGRRLLWAAASETSLSCDEMKFIEYKVLGKELASKNAK